MNSTFWSGDNPVDILGDADVRRYEVALRACAADPNIDAPLMIYTPQSAAAPTDVARVVARSPSSSDVRKPILTVWMGEERVEGAREVFSLTC